MGYRYKLRCDDCGGQWNVKVGYGMMASDKKVVIESFQPEFQPQVTEMIKDAPVPPYGFAYRLCKCSFCKNILSVPSIIRKDIKFREPCPVCGKEVELLDDKSEKLDCPNCNGKVSTEDISFWD